MVALATTLTERKRHFVAVSLALSVAALIYGFTLPLLSLVLSKQGVNSTVIGLSTATQSLAIFVVAPWAPWAMRRFGPAHLMLWTIVASIVLILLLPVFPNVYAWFPLRFLLGLAWSLLWIVGEAWINQFAEERTRGRFIAIYAMAVTAGFGIGPLILVLTGSEGWTPFIAAAAIMALAVPALLTAVRAASDFKGHASVSLLRFFALAPAIMLMHACFAAGDGMLLTFLPLYGVQLGLSEPAALTLITLLAVGGIAFQWPVGWLADHMDRMLLVILVVIAILAGAATMPLYLAHAPWNSVCMFLFGGALGAIYTLGLVVLGERFKGADLAAAASLFGVMWSLGSIAGPPLGGAGMQYVGVHGMPITLVLLFLAYLPFPVVVYWRKLQAR